MKNRLKKRNRLTIKQKLNKFLTKEVNLMTGYQKLKQKIKDQNETNEILKEALIEIIEKTDLDEIHKIAIKTINKSMYRYFYEEK